MNLASIRPNLAAFGAVGTNINFVAPFEQELAKIPIGFALPKLLERRFFEVAEPVKCVFIEATRHHQAVPSDDASVPKFPTMVQ